MKIFGIGLPRTGTASLSEALALLGYKTRHYPKYIARADDYDALVDTPVCNQFECLDRKYPNSKFVLTTREITSWLLSCQRASKRFMWRKIAPQNRSGPEVYQSHIDIFGTLSYNQDKFIDGYGKHLKRVLHYFKKRNDLLIFDVKSGWEPLCSFLNHEVPTCNFPHINKS